MPRNRLRLNSRAVATGSCISTSHVCMRPFIQRVRWAHQWRKRTAASSNAGAEMVAARQPEAEVGIFGHVPGVPAASGFEVVAPEITAGSAERQGYAEAGEEGQPDEEMNGVFDIELPGDPGLFAVVGQQRGPNHGELLASRPQSRNGLARSGEGWPVLGVERRNDLAAQMTEAVIERARFRSGMSGRHGQDFDPAGSGVRRRAASVRPSSLSTSSFTSRSPPDS